MKKMVFLVLLSVCSCALQAQLQFGLKAGYNMTSFNVNPFLGVSYSSKSDFNAGFLLSLPISGVLAFQPEVVYSGEGAYVDVNGLKGDYNLQRLNFPLLLKFKAPLGYFIETGPQIGFLLSADLTEDGFGSTNIRNDTKTPAYSWTVGVGYQLPMNLGFDVRYNFGLSNIAKNNYGSYNNTSIKNNVLQIGLYYVFSSPPAVVK